MATGNASLWVKSEEPDVVCAAEAILVSDSRACAHRADLLTQTYATLQQLPQADLALTDNYSPALSRCPGHYVALYILCTVSFDYLSLPR